MEKVLDNGYVDLVDTWGSDRHIIEAARMSTDKGFLGWDRETVWICPVCQYTLVNKVQPWVGAVIECPAGHGQMDIDEKRSHPGDKKLLAYLWKHKHATPFEMAGMTIEVQAPIFVFREWHRHRTQSYNELSARYTPLPDVNYRPTRERIIDGAKGSGNRQASGSSPLRVEAIDDWLKALDAAYEGIEQTYQAGLAIGIPKEIARVVVPVGRYSKMRASANLRNWLQFLELRLAPNAQWEIRQYAGAVAKLVQISFPRTYELFSQGEHSWKT